MEAVELAGDRMSISESADGMTTTITFDDKGTGRVCGDCQLCCKLVPVPTISKPAGAKCQHQRASKGCMIYADRPFACRTWTCRWLSDPTTTMLRRPDRSHFVVDVSPDYIELEDNETGERQRCGVMQVWLDPAFPEARLSAELRAYAIDVAARLHIPLILRTPGKPITVLIAPSLSADRKWHEQGGKRREDMV